VDRDDLPELHYIVPLENLASIRQHGIVCHRHAARVSHRSVASTEVQSIRAGKRVPNGLSLHDYVNLYINARNKMLFKLRDLHRELAVLRISSGVLDLPGAVIADHNAASSRARFSTAPEGLARIDRDLVFARYWTHPNDPATEEEHGSVMCAEVLLPSRLDPQHVLGGYVSCEESRRALVQIWPELPVTVRGYLFFR
jgi:hypothetical protein